ncbi:MAG: hypothetical protein NVS3B21_03410 [Acidimicrobiales bacterium]
MTLTRISRFLLYAGCVAMVIGAGRYHAQFIGHYYFHSWDRLPWNVCYAVLLGLTAYGVGLPDSDGEASVWVPAIVACVLAAAGISFIQLVLGSLLLPRFVVFTTTLAAPPWLVLCSTVYRRSRIRSDGRDRVIVVASPTDQLALDADISRAPERPAMLVCKMTSEQARPTQSQSKPLIDHVLANRATVVVLDRQAISDQSIVRQAATLHESGVRVRSLASFYEEWLGKLPLAELERASLLFDIGGVHHLRYSRIKRLIDVLFATIGMVAVVALIAIILPCNVIWNKGPLFYRQARVGRMNRQFQIIKFRTMRPGNTDSWTSASDDRVTAFGRILRRSHLDEIPQFLNIFRGEQSLVGPRPEQPRYVQELRRSIPFYDLRHLVQPGLTGWAQVKHGYGSSEEDAVQKLQYEVFYMRHQSLGLDIRILGRTIRSVMGGGGR